MIDESSISDDFNSCVQGVHSFTDDSVMYGARNRSLPSVHNRVVCMQDTCMVR